MTHRRLARCLLAVLLLALPLAGCRALGLSREPITLRLMAPHGADDQALQALLDAYAVDRRGVTVELVNLSPWPYLQDELAAAVAEARVDVIRGLNAPMGDDALALWQAGLIQPLDAYLTDAWDELRADSYPGAWQALAHDGHQLGVPASLDPIVVYATSAAAAYLEIDLESAWNAAGSPNQPIPWTTDDLAATAALLHQPRGLPELPALRIEGLCADMFADPAPLALIHLRGGALLDDLSRPTQPALDRPATIAAAAWYAGLYAQGAVGDPPRDQQGLYHGGGLAEAAGSCACGLWFGRYGDRDGAGTAYPWRCAATMLPLPADAAPTGLAWVEGYYLADATPHPNQALDLIRYLTAHAAATGSRLPVRLSVARDAAYLDALPAPVARTARAYTQTDGAYWGRTTLISLAAADRLVPTIGEPTLLSSLHAAIDRIARGHPAEDAMRDAQRAATW